MTEMEKNTIKKAMPIYTLTSIEKIQNNPYREFVHYAAYTVYNKLSNHIDLSLRDFANRSYEDQIKVLTAANEYVDNVNIVFNRPNHPKVFLDANYMSGDKQLCNIKFYSYTKFCNSDETHYACELDFSNNDIFDFLDIQKSDNFLDFTKTDLCDMSIDMILSCLYIFANPVEFIKVYKAKSIVTKNIVMLTKKLIEPIVTDMNIVFTPEYFYVGVICGTNIIKETYTYDNYFESIKNFANGIKEKFGDIYKREVSSGEN